MPYKIFLLVAALKPRMNTDIYIYVISSENMLSTKNNSSRQVVFNYRKNTDIFGIHI